MKKSLILTLFLAAANPAGGATLAQWTFDDTGSGTQAQRLPVALGSSNVGPGMTASQLFINPSHDFAGFANVPGSANDGFGFGDNSGQAVMFFHRANYFTSAGTTTWGNPNATPGIDTTVVNSPISFSVSASGAPSVTIESLTLNRLAGPDLLINFQEAGATAGASPPAGNQSATAFLNSPVVITSGETKTFTVNFNSGFLNSGHSLNNITLNGTVVPEPTAGIMLGLGAIALAVRRRR